MSNQDRDVGPSQGDRAASTDDATVRVANSQATVVVPLAHALATGVADSQFSAAMNDSDDRQGIALRPGYRLLEYTIESVLGSGGFGITYLAHDNNLQAKVAIKEYLPNDLAVRTSGQTVYAKTDADAYDYRQGLARFLSETRTLATFRHPSIVRVLRFFEANNTAYMVMDYERGESLRNWMQSNGDGLTEARLMAMFVPLLDGLAVVHARGVLHRDIKPANIVVRDEDGSLVLLDFGAAREISAGASRSLTSIITPGYAPLEQYHSHGRQGPWTDIYAFAAVLYWVVTGRRTAEAPMRARMDTMPSAQELARGRYSDGLLRAVDWGLAPDDATRPQSAEEFRAALCGQLPVPLENASPGGTGERAAPAATPVRRRSALVVLVTVAMVAVGAAGWTLSRMPIMKDRLSSQVSAADSATSTARAGQHAVTPVPESTTEPGKQSVPASPSKAAAQTEAVSAAAAKPSGVSSSPPAELQRPAQQADQWRAEPRTAPPPPAQTVVQNQPARTRIPPAVLKARLKAMVRDARARREAMFEKPEAEVPAGLSTPSSRQHGDTPGGRADAR